MIKNTSKSRREYEACYRELRSGGGHFFREVTKQFDDVTADCALLSYDYRDSRFSGWIHRQRETQWWETYSDRYPDLYYQF